MRTIKNSGRDDRATFIVHCVNGTKFVLAASSSSEVRFRADKFAHYRKTKVKNINEII